MVEWLDIVGGFVWLYYLSPPHMHTHYTKHKHSLNAIVVLNKQKKRKIIVQTMIHILQRFTSRLCDATIDIFVVVHKMSLV